MRPQRLAPQDRKTDEREEDLAVAVSGRHGATYGAGAAYVKSISWVEVHPGAHICFRKMFTRHRPDGGWRIRGG